jgi:hypothetical protein
MFVWPKFSTTILNEFRWPLTISANLVSLRLVASLNHKRTRERRIGEESACGDYFRPSDFGFYFDGRNWLIICRDSATGLCCSNWVDVLAKTSFERKKNERPRALRRRIAA